MTSSLATLMASGRDALESSLIDICCTFYPGFRGYMYNSCRERAGTRLERKATRLPPVPMGSAEPVCETVRRFRPWSCPDYFSEFIMRRTSLASAALISVFASSWSMKRS